MFTVSSRLKQRTPVGQVEAVARERVAPRVLPEFWLRAALALPAGVLLAAALAVIGVPAWLSLSLGALAAIRVAAWATGSASVRRR